MSMYGTPGACYIDLPNDLLYAKVNADEINYLPKVELLPPLSLPSLTVDATLALFKSAKTPLVIVGKGIGYGKADEEMRAFIDKTQVPFLSTPMGKGVVPDDHHLNAGSARSYILQNADVIFLCGARLNWMLHFGLPPRFKPDVKFIQLDNDPLEFGTNVKAAIPLCGDAKTILGQLNEKVTAPFCSKDSQWMKNIAVRCEAKITE